jgi:hypothetical protein
MPPEPWRLHRALLLEAFVLGNLAFLAVDIYVAHSVNDFAHPAEWVPIGFSVIGTVVLAVAFPWRPERLRATWRHWAGLAVGGASVLVGVAGLVFHLRSQFFELMTIKSLVYTAPFVAPLAYAGLGLLLIMNRMVDAGSTEWGRWVVFLALGGVFGNFVLALCDHAQNGFFYPVEWAAVFASAFAASFLAVVVAGAPRRGFIRWCHAVLAANVLVGALGFYYHVTANLGGNAPGIWDNLRYGAPVFAPLLLPNIALLAVLGLFQLDRHAM